VSEHHPEETIAVVASELDCPVLPDELIDELLAGVARTPEEITGADGLLQRLTKRLLERALAAELSEHLGYEHGQAPPGGAGNARNGTSAIAASAASASRSSSSAARAPRRRSSPG
jgi:hypothetical protein